MGLGIFLCLLIYACPTWPYRWMGAGYRAGSTCPKGGGEDDSFHGLINTGTIRADPDAEVVDEYVK